MQVGDLVKSHKPYSDTKMGIIIKRVEQNHAENDLWLVHWYDDNPYDEQCWDYHLVEVLCK